MLGRSMTAAGVAVAEWVKRNPSGPRISSRKRILDIGLRTWAQTVLRLRPRFRMQKFIAATLVQPMLRYGLARAKSMATRKTLPFVQE